MSLDDKSKELKALISTYNTQWLLGDLSSLLTCIANGHADDQLGQLSSPMRQLYFLGGLLITSNDENAVDVRYSSEKWNEIVKLLNEIELLYDKIFFPNPEEEIDEEWKKIRQVAMPSFLSYFNQGPLNYEEQTINWVRDLYSQVDDLIEVETGLRTEDFINFYNNLDNYVNSNYQAFSVNHKLIKPDWEKYTKLNVGPREGIPAMMMDLFEERKPMMTFVADHGIIDRFFSTDLISADLLEDKIKSILGILTTERAASDFLYYTSTRPGNPLFDTPIVHIGDGMYQVFEVKQVIHAIDEFLERVLTKTKETTSKQTKNKGKLLEKRILKLLEKFFKNEGKYYTSYYVDGCEQDILYLWKNYAFIIEAKGYNLREPFRDPNRAFVRIKDDFKNSIGYAYSQTKRVEKKFVDQVPLRIEDKDGNLIEEIDTKSYEKNDFSIIVNLKSFGQIQNDLSTLLEIEDDDAFPWVVKFDDLEVFLLTLIAKNKPPKLFIDYLIMRENFHGKLICVLSPIMLAKFKEVNNSFPLPHQWS